MNEETETIGEQFSRTESMGVWEKDSNGNYAGGCDFVDIGIVPLSFPVIGMIGSLIILYDSVMKSSKDYTGIDQQFTRTAVVGAFTSSLSTALLLLVLFL